MGRELLRAGHMIVSKRGNILALMKLLLGESDTKQIIIVN